MAETILSGGVIYPICSESIEKGYIIFKNGKIYDMGKGSPSEEMLRDREEHHCMGKHILPGLIDAHTHLGILEEQTGEIGKDNNETSLSVAPHLRALDGVNPYDAGFQDALRAGVTTVMTGPGSNNPVGGLNMAVKTAGRIIDQMVVKNPAGLKLALGENPMATHGSSNHAPVTRMGTVALIREMFYRAQDYQTLRDTGKLEYRELPMEAVLAALNREIPIRVHAHRADDIVTAVRLADEFQLRLVIEHGTEGYLIRDFLREKNVAVAVGPMLTPRDKMELKNRSYDTARELAEAGVKIALITDHPYNSIEHLRLAAIIAHQEGLNEKIALEAITVNPANILNIDDQTGTLERGKDADIVVMNGHPLDMDSKVEMVYIKGTLVYERSKP
ncbi:MAG: amidohydrolase family protein [Caldicoprobacterales bacterium]|nr:amidohydrolase family protein [Clostridiales bacterium]